MKVGNTHPGGLLQPLPLPSKTWIHIYIDFVEGLPDFQGLNCLWVVVDTYIKYSHFTPLKHPYTIKSVAELFLKSILKFHGLPQSIVFDSDKTFTSHF